MDSKKRLVIGCTIISCQLSVMSCGLCCQPSRKMCQAQQSAPDYTAISTKSHSNQHQITQQSVPDYTAISTRLHEVRSLQASWSAMSRQAVCEDLSRSQYQRRRKKNANSLLNRLFFCNFAHVIYVSRLIRYVTIETQQQTYIYQ